ncbi:hypothetical protein [Deinococcus depolymerans]|uniref:Uncharacterized protein n=1 Tax=Deinococcus depolymerans TaxID=392408 RepID=A0ABP3MM11_9DEIO
MNRLPPLVIALAAALLWLGIGLWQRTQAGTSAPDALLAELPLTLAVFGLAFVWAGRRR